jgi:hypothetical protein
MVSITDLKFDDEDATFETAKALHEKGQLDPASMSMLLQNMLDPSKLLQRLKKAKIEARPISRD